MEPASRYEFAGTVCRGNSAYTDRWTLVELIGADSFTPAHSDNTAVVTSLLQPNQVAIWSGGNHTPETGVIAQWTGIDPGEDGIITIVSTQYLGPVPTSIHSPGLASGSKGYGLAGVRLIEDVPIGPPIIANTPAVNVGAFEAQVGGHIVSTGGDDPDVMLYWGTVDVMTNAGAWENAIPFGKQARFYSTPLDGLEPDTTYFYRSFATNNLGTAWAEDTASFSTLPAAAPQVTTLPANLVGAFSANLRGEITDTGNDTPLVNVYFGDDDAGTGK